MSYGLMVSRIMIGEGAVDKDLFLLEFAKGDRKSPLAFLEL